MVAMLTRQSKPSMPAPGGQQTISRVTPPPFFHGAGDSEAMSKRCTVTLPLQLHAGAELEQLAGQVRLAAGARRGEAQRARLLLRPARAVPSRSSPARVGVAPTSTFSTVASIVTGARSAALYGRFANRRRVDGDVADRDDAERVAVGRRLGDHGRRRCCRRRRPCSRRSTGWPKRLAERLRRARGPARRPGRRARTARSMWIGLAG